MQINSIHNNNNNTTFGIKISKELINGANNVYWATEYNQGKFNRFYRKAKFMQENFGFDNYTIFPKTTYINGKKSCNLYAVKDGDTVENGVLLTAKDNFRKVLDKFIHINEFELKTKIEGNKSV